MKRSIGMLAVLAAASCGFITPAVQAAEPRCNVMQFFDAKGVLMATPAPVIGMMVGDKAVYDPPMPNASAVKPGAEAACPNSLLEGVRSTFEQACMSELRRRQAAQEHKVDKKVIDKGCTDMVASMGSALAAPK